MIYIRQIECENKKKKRKPNQFASKRYSRYSISKGAKAMI